VYPNKRIPKPIPTATLTPTSSHDQQQVAVEPHPSRVTPPTSSAPSSATLPTPHVTLVLPLQSLLRPHLLEKYHQVI
uniref:Uncharacterized protein n=1 Tax=Amphimedon queenslandica TaxID=400682 RepID=A0A1X7T386_AMPQE